jgi:hypothetical protein
MGAIRNSAARESEFPAHVKEHPIPITSLTPAHGGLYAVQGGMSVRGSKILNQKAIMLSS